MKNGHAFSITREYEKGGNFFFTIHSHHPLRQKCENQNARPSPDQSNFNALPLRHVPSILNPPITSQIQQL